MSVTRAEVVDALRPVVDPLLGRGVVELGMVRDVRISRRRVEVVVALPADEHPRVAELEARLRDRLLELPDVREAVIVRTVMSEPEQAELARSLHGDPAATAGATAAHGHAEGRAVPFAEPGSGTRVLLVASGKGGVGKSSVTVNLAVSLARRGKRVAVVDADVWGFSIPAMLGVDHPPTLIDQMVVPPEAHGVRVASIGFFVKDDQPVIWRGPMLHKALEQFLTDFWWDEPDFLVVDLPPGTGDVSLSLASFMPRAEAYIVTTPQPAAQRVAQRAGLMFQSDRIKIPVRGVIENMSWFTGDDGKRYELFGAGGGEALATRLGVPLLGRVPLVPELREGGDAGTPIVVADPEAEASRAFAALAETIDVELAPKRRYNKKLKLV